MVEIKKHDTKTLIGLVSEEIDRVGEARKKHGFYDSGYFYHLIDIPNKLLATPLDEEPILSISGEEQPKKTLDSIKHAGQSYDGLVFKSRLNSGRRKIRSTGPGDESKKKFGSEAGYKELENRKDLRQQVSSKK